MIEQSAVQKFKASLRGTLLQPADPDYDQARKVWNGMIDRRPAMIARCAGVADVVQCVNFARANNLLVAVRGGGHNIGGNAVCDGGLTIDLSPMKSVRVDPARRIARAEPGLTWREFDGETQAFGLATTGGRPDFRDRHRRTDFGRRLGLFGAPLRPFLRQPPVGGCCHG
jgi:FAD/FMN-containing dehydrogenase